MVMLKKSTPTLCMNVSKHSRLLDLASIMPEISMVIFGGSALSAAVTDSYMVGCSAAVQAFPADFCLSDSLLFRTATLN